MGEDRKSNRTTLRGGAAASLDPDVAGLYHLRPCGDVLSDHLRERRGRGRRGRRATDAQPLLHIRLLEDARDRLIEPRDDLTGRARGRALLDRVAVRVGARRNLGADRAAGAGAVVDDELLAVLLGIKTGQARTIK